MHKEFIESVRDDLRHYAGIVDEGARRVERYCADLAIEIEDKIRNADKYDLSIDKMDSEYSIRKDDFGNQLYYVAEKHAIGELIVGASTTERVPFTDDIKRQVKLYEYLKPTFIRMFDGLQYVDEVWFFEKKHNISLGRIAYLFSDYLIPGMDPIFFYDLGLTFYDWFNSVDKEQNPDRKPTWSPLAFMDLFNQWIMNMEVPVYENRYAEKEEMIGIIGTHFNLNNMTESTIEKNAVRMMIIKDASTLIGMNRAAKRDIQLETYDIKKFGDDISESYAKALDATEIENKKRFVHETLNLENNKPAEIASFLAKLKGEFQFRHTLYGREYLVIREKASEFGLDFIALLDGDDWI